MNNKTERQDVVDDNVVPNEDKSLSKSVTSKEIQPKKVHLKRKKVTQ